MQPTPMYRSSLVNSKNHNVVRETQIKQVRQSIHQIEWSLSDVMPPFNQTLRLGRPMYTVKGLGRTSPSKEPMLAIQLVSRRSKHTVSLAFAFARPIQRLRSCRGLGVMYSIITHCKSSKANWVWKNCTYLKSLKSKPRRCFTSQPGLTAEFLENVPDGVVQQAMVQYIVQQPTEVK